MAIEPEQPQAPPAPSGEPEVAGASAAPPRTEPGPSPPTTADLKDGLARMKGLVEQLRHRLDRRREPRDDR